jgi:PAS domain-containing protein
LGLDRLVGVLLELLVQHSQADRGCLLLVDGTGPAGLRLAAEAETERDRIRVDLHPAGAAPHRVPTRLIEHAGHHQVVLAGNPDELAQYADDPYLAAERPPAAMCVPIVRRDTVLAVLYLEYRRQPTAFSGAHLELLDMLCTQAAIALENATVHARLVEANRVLDATFDQMPVGLVLLDPDLVVRRVSPRAVELIGLPVRPGTTLVELLHVLAPMDPSGQPYEHDHDGVRAATTASPIERDVVLVTQAGERRQLATTSIPLHDEAGALTGVTVLVSPAR